MMHAPPKPPTIGHWLRVLVSAGLLEHALQPGLRVKAGAHSYVVTIAPGKRAIWYGRRIGAPTTASYPIPDNWEIDVDDASALPTLRRHLEEAQRAYAYLGPRGLPQDPRKLQEVDDALAMLRLVAEVGWIAPPERA